VAFEAFSNQAQRRPRSARRRLIYAASIAVHAALVAAGVAYSFWHIEELTPPVVRVTFMASAPPPPPPPPPPAGGGGPAHKKAVTKPHVTPVKTPEIVQPRETPKPEVPEETPKPVEKTETSQKGEKGGVAGGVAGGTVGGTAGGTVGGTVGGKVGGVVGGTGSGPPAKFLPPSMGAAQKLSGADPGFPDRLKRAGAIYRVLAKICVNTGGAVDKVTISVGADPELNENVLTTVKTWRFRPLLANSTPVPFCYPATFEFKSQ
jgi:protein TonB